MTYEELRDDSKKELPEVDIDEYEPNWEVVEEAWGNLPTR